MTQMSHELEPNDPIGPSVNQQDHKDQDQEYQDINEKSETIVVHIFNVPPLTRWRQVKTELLIPNGVSEETILHIQVVDGYGSCIISLNSEESANIILDHLEGYVWNGFYLTVKTDDEVISGEFDGSFLEEPYDNFNNFQHVNNGQSLRTSTIPLPSYIPSQSQPYIPNSLGLIHYGLNPNHPYGYTPSNENLPNNLPAAIPTIPPQGRPQLPQYGIPNPVYYPPIPIGYDRPLSKQPVSLPQRFLPFPVPITKQGSHLQPIDYRINPYDVNPNQYYQRPYQYQSEIYPERPFPNQQRSQFGARNNNKNDNKDTRISLQSGSTRNIDTLKQYPYQNITEINQSNAYDRTRLFIGNIPYTSAWTSLKDHLRTVGSISRVEIPSDPERGSRGFAIATYNNENDAKLAIQLLNGVEFEGRPLTVRYDRFPLKKLVPENNENSESIDLNIRNSNETDEHSNGSKNGLKEIKENKIENENENDKRFEEDARNLIDSITALELN